MGLHQSRDPSPQMKCNKHQTSQRQSLDGHLKQCYPLCVLLLHLHHDRVSQVTLDMHQGGMDLASDAIRLL